MIDLTGKTALVTGAGRGIGAETARRLAAAGADVVVNYVSSRQAAAEVVGQIRELGRQAAAVKADVSEPDDVEAMIDFVRERFGRLNILVSNAAAGGFRPLAQTTQRQFEATLRVNTLGLLHLVNAAADLLSAGPERGKVVAISSHGSLFAIPNYGTIGVSKAAVESLVRQFALERGEQINFNTVLSGVVATEAIRTLPGSEEMLSVAAQQSLAERRNIAPRDIADAVLFLCSPLSDMVQGQTLICDGGLCVRI